MNIPAPSITIGMTCFNAEDLIITALKHALEQDWENYEIVIVDDASSDNSVALIEDFIKNYKNITLLRHTENKGFPSSLNTIIENSKGDYLVFFDDDDISAPNRLTKQYQRLSNFIKENNTPLVMCYTNRKVEYAKNEHPSYNFTAIGSVEGKEPHGDMVTDYILWHSGKLGYAWGMFGSCTLMAHKDLFKQLGAFDTQFRRNTEWDMAIRCARSGGYFISVNEPLVTQTKTPTADKSGKKPLKYSLMLREKYKDYLKNKHVYLASRLIAHSRFYGGKAKKIKSFLYMLVALIMAPHAILKDKIEKICSRI